MIVLHTTIFIKVTFKPTCLVIELQINEPLNLIKFIVIMEPGCFCSCLNRNENALVKDLDTSRATKKRMIKIMRHSKRAALNPEKHHPNDIYNREQTTEPNSSLLCNIQSIKLPYKSFDVQIEPNRQIQSHSFSKTYRHNQTISLLEESSWLNSARCDRQSRQRPNRPSSLYGGAKGIIKRMSVVDQLVQPQQLQKTQAFKQQKVSQNSLSIKQHITLRNSYRWLNESECTSNQGDDPFQAITIPQAFSSFSLPKETGRDLRVGKILGRGKYSHSYLSQDIATHCLVTTKYIFKKGLLPDILSSIKNSIQFLTKFNHPLILDCYGCSQDEEKITIFAQYTFNLLYDQINSNGKLPLTRVRQALKQIIEAVIIMHEKNIAHGNLSPIQIGYTMQVCKIRISLTNSSSSKSQYIHDIHSIALMGFEMAYGLSKNIDKLNPLRDELGYYNIQDLRQKIIEELKSNKISDKGYKSMNQFLLVLLTQNDNMRLCASYTLTHPFFLGTELEE